MSPVLAYLKTTKITCVCPNSFWKPLENFAKNFGVCPVSLEKVDGPFYVSCEVPLKAGLFLSQEDLDLGGLQKYIK